MTEEERMALRAFTDAEYAQMVAEVRDEVADEILALSWSNDVVKYLEVRDRQMLEKWADIMREGITK